jgi:hypothetical protein
MRVGDSDTYLLLEETVPGDSDEPLRMEVRTAAGRAAFSGFNAAVFFGNGTRTEAELSAFSEFTISTVTIPMTEGCALVLDRDSHGNIRIKYVVAHWHPMVVRLTGTVQVAGEFAQGFLADLRALVRRSATPLMGTIVSRTVVDLPEPFARRLSLPILAEASVQSAIREGRFRSSPSSPFPPGPELLRTYRRRAEHLRAFSTPHAEQLRADVLGFCAALEALPPECPIVSCSLELDDGRSIVLFERADTNELIGILRTVDRRMVSDQEWATLWGGGDAG